VNILAIGPHPDDIEIGCAGTLIKYAQKGHNIFLLLISKGQMGGEGKIRYKEQMKAADIIGAREVFWAGLMDTG
jgi:LmbE family N-acetylglucosaminyl deacetylase